MAKKKSRKKITTPLDSPPTTKKQKSLSMALGMKLFCVAFAFLLYANTLGHQYTLDDFSVIKDNYVTKQGIEGIPTLLTTNYRFGYWNSEGTLYRPISMVMFAIEWELFEDQPWIHHLISVLLYAFTAWLLFITLRRWWHNKSGILAFAVTLIYIAHPITGVVSGNLLGIL